MRDPGARGAIARVKPAGAPTSDVRRMMVVVRPGELPEEIERVRRALTRAGIDVHLRLEQELPVPLHLDADAAPRAAAPPAASPAASVASSAPPDGWRPDVVLALGGDGTVLRALDRFPDSPVLAINFGTVGFLTSGDRGDLDRLLFRLLSGDYFLDERMMLRSTFAGRDHDVVNEVMLKGTTHLVTVDVVIDGHLVHTVRGDGVVLGTPTGSTAYLLSTGSPIVMPSVECFILAGINEHSFSSRPLVIDPCSEVRLRVHEATGRREMFVSHDGRDRHVARVGDEVVVVRSTKKAKLIFFEREAFFTNLRARLNW